MSVEKQTVHALKWASVGKLAGQVISWAVTLAVLRLLSPEDYGLMAMVSVIVSILANIAELGLGASIVQAPKLATKELQQANGLVMLINLAAFAVLLIAAPLVGHFFGDDRLTILVRVASLQFVLNALSTVPQAIAYRDMDFRRLAWIELAAVILASVATLVLAWLGAGVWALVIGSLVQLAARTVLLLQRGFVRPSFSLAGMRQFLAFGGAVTLSRLAWQVVSQSDVLIAGRLMTPAAVGLYSISLHVATLPMQKIMGIINQVAFPAVARMQDDMERLRRRLLEASRIMTVVSIPVLWGISSVAPEFVRLVMGGKWLGGIFPLQVICLVVPFRMLNAVFATAVLGIGRAGLNVHNTAVSMAVLPICFLVGTHWGVNGLACAWLIAVPLVFTFNFPRMAGAFGLTVRDVGRAVWTPVVAGAAMTGSVYACRLLTPDLPDLARLALLIAVGASVYAFTLEMINREIRPELLRIFRAARD